VDRTLATPSQQLIASGVSGRSGASALQNVAPAGVHALGKWLWKLSTRACLAPASTPSTRNVRSTNAGQIQSIANCGDGRIGVGATTNAQELRSALGASTSSTHTEASPAQELFVRCALVKMQEQKAVQSSKEMWIVFSALGHCGTNAQTPVEAANTSATAMLYSKRMELASDALAT